MDIHRSKRPPKADEITTNDNTAFGKNTNVVNRLPPEEDGYQKILRRRRHVLGSRGFLFGSPSCSGEQALLDLSTYTRRVFFRSVDEDIGRSRASDGMV
ncbi:hypothetical protein ALCH109712_14105 [Alkalicoccus chagannorensis]